jgi:ABC-type dipeptide/oligopeptide/nickel transport system ATPase component
MDSYINVFKEIDPDHKITKNDFIPNCGLPFELSDMYHGALIGKSRSGKSVVLSNLMIHYYLHVIEP